MFDQFYKKKIWSKDPILSKITSKPSSPSHLPPKAPQETRTKGRQKCRKAKKKACTPNDRNRSHRKWLIITATVRRNGFCHLSNQECRFHSASPLENFVKSSRALFSPSNPMPSIRASICPLTTVWWFEIKHDNVSTHRDSCCCLIHIYCVCACVLHLVKCWKPSNFFF